MPGLPNDDSAAVLYASKATSTISFRFAELAWQAKPALASSKSCEIRSIWGNTTTESGQATTEVRHGSAVEGETEMDSVQGMGWGR